MQKFRGSRRGGKSIIAAPAPRCKPLADAIVGRRRASPCCETTSAITCFPSLGLLGASPLLPATASLSGSPSPVSAFSSHGMAKYSVGAVGVSGVCASEINLQLVVAESVSTQS